MRKLKTAVYDVETNGLLDKLDTIHVLVIQEWETGQRLVFRKNKREDTIAKGIKILEEAEAICGHNIINFDNKAVKKVFPDFRPKGKIIDTLVMSRLICSTQKQADYRLFHKGVLPGKLIGSHSLETWGMRLGKHKGDYSKEMESKGLDPWAEWNQDMEDYCIQDVEVNCELYTMLIAQEYPQNPINVEHEVHSIMSEQEMEGVFFDVEAAKSLSEKLQKELQELKTDATDKYGSWYAPAKKKVVAPLWDDPKGVNKAKKYEKIEYDLGEDDSRKIWAVITHPKKTLNYKDPKRGSYTLGSPYCKVTRKEFNPASRDHIIDRFTVLHDWQPIDFTDKGRPSVSADVLESLTEVIPMAKDLKEIFFLAKILGYVSTGNYSWMNCVKEDGKIHAYVNSGGTVTGRASHSFPNLAQAPAATVLDIVDGVVMKKGKPFDISPDEYEVHGDKALIFGRKGNYGADCRNLFYVPDTHWQVGVDLKGIEFRCLANMTYKFDNGQLLDLILHADIHQYNADTAKLPSRDVAKTVIYALIYGGGDLKIGTIVEPTWSINRRYALGREIRYALMEGMPGLSAANDAIQQEAAKGFVWGLDGRKIYIRKAFAALNAKLQSDGAIISKEWLIRTWQYLREENLTHGWEGDFSFMMWIHDELQIAAREGKEDIVKEICLEAAIDAGEFYDFVIPTEADGKVGTSWAESH